MESKDYKLQTYKRIKNDYPQIKLSNNEMNKQINGTIINNNEPRYLGNVQMIQIYQYKQMK